ncbi:MAG: SUMF1/EgtB/PvdO family nonheme iron enzyme [Phycisphaerales bacterium]
MAMGSLSARVTGLVVCAVAGALGGPAVGGVFVGDEAFEWSTIGAPGNRNPTPEEAGHTGSPLDWDPVGSVGYSFRLSRTPVTASQFIEFVQAYKPFATAQEYYGQTGSHLNLLPPVPVVYPGAEDLPATPSLRLAKKFANWLHNGKVSEAWAFADGVYDTSTFGVIEDENGNFVGYTDQVGPKPGAKVWIPSEAEYVKALYYDPHRYGEGEEGYWMYPDGGNEPLVPGPPGVGETDAGYSSFIYHDVGSYPNTQSPWGVLDVSGGDREWTDSTLSGLVVTRSSIRGGGLDADLLWVNGLWAPMVGGTTTFRLATPVPGPGTSALMSSFYIFTLSRRRRYA